MTGAELESLSDDALLQTVQTCSVYARVSPAHKMRIIKAFRRLKLVTENTNQYLTGKEKAPEGITVVGGKTGTTGAAGYCLVLYSYNASGQPIVSIVLKADGKSNLYLLMNEMLSGFAN